MTMPVNRTCCVLLLATASLAAILPAAPAPLQPAASPATRPAATQPLRKRPKLDTAQPFFVDGVIPRIKVEFAKAEADKLRQNPRAYVHATLREKLPGKDEVVYKDVAIHCKGSAGSFRNFDDRPAFSINFGRYVQGQRFHGMPKIHLNNSVQDPVWINENIGGWIYREAGIPAPRVTNARMFIDNRDMGMYVLIEGFDTTMLKRYFHDSSGMMYEGNCQEVDQAVPPEGSKSRRNEARLKALVAAANERDPALRRQKIEKVLDVDHFITLVIIESMLAHWDGYAGNRNNYRLYDEPTTGRFFFMPHGMDQLFGQSDYPMVPSNGLLARVLTETPLDRQQYMDRYLQLRQTLFDPEKLTKRVDEISARIVVAMVDMGPDAVRQHKEQAAGLKQRIIERVKCMDRQLGLWPKPLRFDGGVAKIANWEGRSDSGNIAIDRIDEGGKPRLRFRCGNGGGVASARASVPLLPGHYVLEGMCRVTGVVTVDAPNNGAGLRISGEKRVKGLTGDSGWQKVEYEFDVADGGRDIVLVCELRATRGEAMFDLESLKLRKK